MIVRGVGRALATLALVVMTVGACDDNPLAEDREDAAYFRLNPSSVAVNAGGAVKVDAVLVNKFGGGLNQAVTGTACDNKISAVADTGRSVFEFPERFVITGMTLGTSCLVVRGGGITDTIQVRVVPASINVVGADTVGSGETLTPTVQFLNAAGQPVTGLTASSIRWTSLTTSVAVVDSLTGEISGRAPGAGRIIARLSPEHGVTRIDTLFFTVSAGAFTGTVSPNPIPRVATPVTFNAGAVPFDANTTISFDGIIAPVISRTATQMVVVAPGGANAQSQFVLANLGPNEVASRGTVGITNTASDPQEPNNDFPEATPVTQTTTFYVTLDDDADQDDIFRFDSPVARQVRVNMDWNDTDALLTVLGYNASGVFDNNTCHTTAKPKNCVINLPAGTYYIDIWRYTLGAAGSFSGVGIYPKVTGTLTFTFL